MKKESLKKIICGVLIGCLTISTGAAVFAFADDETNADITKYLEKFKRNQFQRGAAAYSHKGLETILASLVENGTISQEKMDSIIAYIEAKQQELQKQFKNRGTKLDIVAELEQNGIITSEEAAAIKAKCQEKIDVNRESKAGDRFEALVESALITEEQLNSIKTFMEQKQEERKAEFEAVKDMTAEERKAYLEEKRAEHINRFDEMVAAGLITQEQADELKESMPEGRMGHKAFEGKQGSMPGKMLGGKRSGK